MTGVVTGRTIGGSHALETRNTGDNISEPILPANSEKFRNLFFAHAHACELARILNRRKRRQSGTRITRIPALDASLARKSL